MKEDHRLHALSDQLLWVTFHKAIDMNLDCEFIRLVCMEMLKRSELRTKKMSITIVIDGEKVLPSMEAYVQYMQEKKCVCL